MNGPSKGQCRQLVYAKYRFWELVDFGLIVGVVFVLGLGFEFYTTFAVAKQLKENKAKTGRYSQPWNTMHPIRKGLVVAMPCILIGLFFWLYNYSIFAPGPGELYNPEIAAVGLLFALTLIGSFWIVRN